MFHGRAQAFWGGRSAKARHAALGTRVLVACWRALKGTDRGSSAGSAAMALGIDLVDYGAKRNGFSKADLHVFSKLFDDGLERVKKPRHFLGVRLAVMTMSWISSSDI